MALMLCIGERRLMQWNREIGTPWLSRLCIGADFPVLYKWRIKGVLEVLTSFQVQFSKLLSKYILQSLRLPWLIHNVLWEINGPWNYREIQKFNLCRFLKFHRAFFSATIKWSIDFTKAYFCYFDTKFWTLSFSMDGSLFQLNVVQYFITSLTILQANFGCKKFHLVIHCVFRTKHYWHHRRDLSGIRITPPHSSHFP